MHSQEQPTWKLGQFVYDEATGQDVFEGEEVTCGWFKLERLFEKLEAPRKAAYDEFGDMVLYDDGRSWA